MSDLRAAVEGLRLGEENIARETGRGLDSIGYSRACYDVLRLIPESAVLVTEAELEGAFRYALYLTDYDEPTPKEAAAAILRHLREAE